MSASDLSALEARRRAMLAAAPLEPEELAGFVASLELTGYLPLGAMQCLTLLRAKAEVAEAER